MKINRIAPALAALALAGGLSGCAAGEGISVAAPESSAATKAQKPAQPTAKGKAGTAETCLRAAGHWKITKVQVSDGLISTADVFTGYTGGIVGPHGGTGKLIAAAFAGCASTKDGDGLVTVYDAAGDILSNGNF